MITNMTKTAAMDALIANDIDGYEPGWDLRGLRGDTKPTGATVPNGSSFIEMDTGDVYLWDADNSQWRPI